MHSPDVTKEREERRMFYEQLEKELDKLSYNHKLLIVEDFNDRSRNDYV